MNWETGRRSLESAWKGDHSEKVLFLPRKFCRVALANVREQGGKPTQERNATDRYTVRRDREDSILERWFRWKYAILFGALAVTAATAVHRWLADVVDESAEAQRSATAANKARADGAIPVPSSSSGFGTNGWENGLGWDGLPERARKLLEANGLRSTSGPRPAPGGLDDGKAPPKKLEPGSSPTWARELVFKPTQTLEQAMEYADTVARPDLIESVEEFNERHGSSVEAEGLAAPVKTFGDAIKEGIPLKECFEKVFDEHGIMGKRALDVVISEKYDEYVGKMEKYKSLGRTSKEERYRYRLDLMLQIQMEFDKSFEFK